MADFPEIGYGTVTGRFLAGILDSEDAAAAPDVEPLQGEVVFSPTASALLVNGATPPATMFPLPVRVKLDDAGNISHEGSLGVSLWATDDPDGNPVDWQWHVHFELTFRGRGVYRAPFNFELPTGETVDLTVVAPLVVLEDGTVIIRGPAGPPGPSALDLIDAKGDLVAGTADNAAAVIPVGAPGEYLTPNPAIPTGLEWQPLPVPEAGLKEYPDRAALDAVRAAEVGVWHVPDVSAAFGGLIAANPGLFEGTGPAELVVTTQIMDHPLNSGVSYVDRANVLQSFEVPGTSPPRVMYRAHQIDRVTGAIVMGPYQWSLEPVMIQPVNADVTLLSVPGASGFEWATESVAESPVGNSIVRRDQQGGIRAYKPGHNSTPIDQNDVVNVEYLETAIAAIPPTPLPPHTHPEIGGTHRFLLDATADADPGVGRVAIANAGGQNRTLFVSKTDADGGDVFLAPLAVNDSIVLVNDGDPSPTIYARGYASSVVTDAGTHWEFSAVRESGVGALPGDGTSMLLTITMANGAGAAAPVGALTVYPDVAALDAVRTAEIGTLHVDDLALAFPGLAALHIAFQGHGPADLVIESSVNDYNSDVAPNDFLSYVIQTMTVNDLAWGPLRISRGISFQRPGGSATAPSLSQWAIEPKPLTMPIGTGTQGDLYVRQSASGTGLRRLPAPTVAGHVLTADPIQSNRMVWAKPAPAPLTVYEWGTPTGGTYVVSADDAGKLFAFNNPGPITIQLPATGFPTGGQVHFVQKAATGPLTITSDGVLFAPGGRTVLAGQYSKVTATKLNYSEWVIEGDLAVP